jgi:hypothetical protein
MEYWSFLSRFKTTQLFIDQASNTQFCSTCRSIAFDLCFILQPNSSRVLNVGRQQLLVSLDHSIYIHTATLSMSTQGRYSWRVDPRASLRLANCWLDANVAWAPWGEKETYWKTCYQSFIQAMQFRNDDKVPTMKSCQSHFNDLIEEFKVKVENDQAATGAGTAWTELDAVLKTCLDQINAVKEEKKCKAEQTAADKATRAAEDSFVISSCLKRLKEKPSYMKVVDSSDAGLSDESADSDSSSSDWVALGPAAVQFSSCVGRAASVTAAIAGCNESSDISDSSASTSSATHYTINAPQPIWGIRYR